MRFGNVVFLLMLFGGGAYFALNRGELLPQTAGDSTPEQAEEVPAVAMPPVRVQASQGSSAATAFAEKPPGLSRATFDKNADAIARLNAGELEDAVRLFEECIEEAPDEEVLQHNLAEAYAQLAVQTHGSDEEDGRARGLELLEQAAELNPGRTDLPELIERWRKAAESEEGFWRKVLVHFELSFDGTRDELMWGTTPLENELEAAYHEFGDLFGFYPVEEGRPRIRVVLHRREDFDHVTGLGDWAGGVYDGTVRVPVKELGREIASLKKVLRHELIHAFVSEAGGKSVPGWLNEGVAQYFEAPFSSGRVGDIERAKDKLRGKELFGLDKLGGSLISLEKEDIRLAYAQSLAFVDYLDRMYGQRVLVDMVAGCKVGKKPEQTFREGIGIELTVVLEDFARAY